MHFAEEPGRVARRAVTRATFRLANEEIASKALALDARDAPLPFVCECVDRCVELVLMTLEEFEHVRRDVGGFVVVPGHEDVDEQVLRVAERYVIVAETGELGDLSAAFDA